MILFTDLLDTLPLSLPQRTVLLYPHLFPHSKPNVQLCTPQTKTIMENETAIRTQKAGFALCHMETHEDMHSSASSASFYWQQLLCVLCAAALAQHSQQCAETCSGSPLASALPWPVGASSEIPFLAVHRGRLD